MTKEEALAELRELLDYWRYIDMYDSEQEAVEFAIKYMEEN